MIPDFFLDQVNIYELYNGLLNAHSQNKSLGLDSAIKHLQSKYETILGRNDQFKEIEAAYNLSSAAVKKQIEG